MCRQPQSSLSTGEKSFSKLRRMNVWGLKKRDRTVHLDALSILREIVRSITLATPVGENVTETFGLQKASLHCSRFWIKRQVITGTMEIDSSPEFYGNPFFFINSYFGYIWNYRWLFFCHLFVMPMHGIDIRRTLMGQPMSAYKLRKLHKSKTFDFYLSLFRHRPF